MKTQQNIVVNTHRGLFKYTKLPFGVSSAPAIFQRVMEGSLQNVPGVMVYLDDILITRKTKEDRLSSFAKVLVKFQEAGQDVTF